jgi:hypothetical protein
MKNEGAARPRYHDTEWGDPENRYTKVNQDHHACTFLSPTPALSPTGHHPDVAAAAAAAAVVVVEPRHSHLSIHHHETS